MLQSKVTRRRIQSAEYSTNLSQNSFISMKPFEYQKFDNLQINSTALPPTLLAAIRAKPTPLRTSNPFEKPRRRIAGSAVSNSFHNPFSMNPSNQYNDDSFIEQQRQQSFTITTESSPTSSAISKRKILVKKRSGGFPEDFFSSSFSCQSDLMHNEELTSIGLKENQISMYEPSAIECFHFPPSTLPKQQKQKQILQNQTSIQRKQYEPINISKKQSQLSLLSQNSPPQQSSSASELLIENKNKPQNVGRFETPKFNIFEESNSKNSSAKKRQSEQHQLKEISEFNSFSIQDTEKELNISLDSNFHRNSQKLSSLNLIQQDETLNLDSSLCTNRSLQCATSEISRKAKPPKPISNMNHNRIQIPIIKAPSRGNATIGFSSFDEDEDKENCRFQGNFTDRNLKQTACFSNQNQNQENKVVFKADVKNTLNMSNVQDKKKMISAQRFISQESKIPKVFRQNLPQARKVRPNSHNNQQIIQERVFSQLKEKLQSNTPMTLRELDNMFDADCNQTDAKDAHVRPTSLKNKRTSQILSNINQNNQSVLNPEQSDELKPIVMKRRSYSLQRSDDTPSISQDSLQLHNQYSQQNPKRTDARIQEMDFSFISFEKPVPSNRINALNSTFNPNSSKNGGISWVENKIETQQSYKEQRTTIDEGNNKPKSIGKRMIIDLNLKNDQDSKSIRNRIGSRSLQFNPSTQTNIRTLNNENSINFSLNCQTIKFSKK